MKEGAIEHIRRALKADLHLVCAFNPHWLAPRPTIPTAATIPSRD